ncbi:hypothetical protein Tco_0206307 [Tanacetum coccineum]
METANSSVPKRSTVILFRLPSRQSAHLTPPAPVPTTEKADEMILQDMIQVSLAEQKSHEEQEARENVALVAQHLPAEEIEKLVEESENVDDSSPTRHDDTFITGTRIEPKSDKESPEVDIDQEKEEETTKDTKVEPNIVIPVNVNDEEVEITDEVFELRRRVKRKNVEESRISPIPSPTRSPMNPSTLGSLDTKKLQELTVTHPTPSSVGLSLNYKVDMGYLFAHLKKRFMPLTLSDQLADNLHDVMMETLPSLVKEKVTKQVKKEVPVQVIDHVLDFARIKKYQAQQQRLASKSERRKFYTSVLAGWKTKDFRGMTFDQLEEKFIPVWESIQDFVPMDSKKESESLKRSGILLEKVKAKSLKTSDVSAQEQQESDNQDEIINLQQWAVLVREETSVNITPSVVKVPICDWKIYKDKLREVYQIFRVGQAPKVYPYFESMLKDFDRDDLVTLWKLVKDRFKTELPKSDLEKCLFWPLKVMFEPVATDLLWQFEAPIKSWKMYKSCKVHCLSMEGMIIYMLDDVEYPFQKTTLKKMLDHKCEVSEFNEDVIQMINLIRGQLKKE